MKSVKFSERFLMGVALSDVEKAHDAILGAFMWTDSPQGYDAWKAVVAALAEILKAKERTPASEWIKWDGGECPVAQDVEVCARFADGDTTTDTAGRLGWGHDHGAANIVAYKVVG